MKTYRARHVYVDDNDEMRSDEFSIEASSVEELGEKAYAEALRRDDVPYRLKAEYFVESGPGKLFVMDENADVCVEVLIADEESFK
jgi:hypothetical protein